MGFIISVYTNEAFREYILPAINNADYPIVLDKSDFNLPRDVSIEFEVINEAWRIKPSRDYRIYLERQEIRETTALSDSQIFRILTYNRRQLILLVRKSDQIFSPYRKYDLRQMSQITIGEEENCLIRCQTQGMIARIHVEIVRRGRGFAIVSGERTGIYINSKFVTGTETLKFGDFINLYGLHMVFLGEILAVDIHNPYVYVDERFLLPFAKPKEAARARSEDEAVSEPVKKLFRRSPRIIEKIEQGEIEIEGPPQENKAQRKPLFMTIGPSFTMAIPMLLGAALMIASSRMGGRSTGLFLYSGLVMAVSSATIGVTWSLINLRYQKKTEKENEKHRYEAYSSYLLEKTEEIKKKYAGNQTALNRMYPDAATCASYDEASPMLWNRNATHEDFLSCRLGQGDMDFQVSVHVPKEGFRLYRDELAEKPGFILENYKTLLDVPILLDLLEHRLVGVSGGKGKKGAIEVAKLLAAQLAACNCYTDVKMIFIYDENNSEDRGKWDFARWLPHVWAEDRKIRYIASNRLEAGEVFYEVSRILRQRAENAPVGPADQRILPRPYFVLFLSDPALIEDEMIAKYVFDPSPAVGLSTVMLSPSTETLPNACEYIVENDSFFQGVYNVSAQKEERVKVRFDALEDVRLEQFARRLSNIEVQEMKAGGEIPNSLTFFEMYGISRPKELKAEERWLKNRNYDNIRGLIGEKSGGAPCYMDVHEKYHGPHGLVAGTTGSGKSETLQTYLLSLAINYSPDDVGFFIIDYKGGGMANLFDGLPHLIGQISNLSGNQVYRAMVSIKSENRRRQRIFTEHGVNNINSYTRMYKNKEATEPIPHLFIIIDEFAELKREEPDFMKELISVAQVGRSLGVHLILATQKPSGTVDDNIWSNSRFRLCLRVQDRQDSNDMLHKPDAAYITQAGRCYLQVGNDEVYELFQSGWSGAPYDETAENGKGEIAKLLTTDGRTEAAGGHARALKKEQALRGWISSLISCYEESRKAGDRLSGDTGGEAASEGLPEELIGRFYERMAMRGLDYPPNPYNTARLEDFVRLYEKAKTERGDTAQKILELSAQLSVKLPEKRELTQLDAVKDYLAGVARENGYQKAHQLWMPVLPDHIYLDQFEDLTAETFTEDGWKPHKGAWSVRIPIGMADDPQNQAQLPLWFDLTEGGHHGIIGSVVSGKSTLIQTILFGLVSKYSPEELNVYGLDFSSKMMSAFEGMPHFGGLMYEGDDEKISKFFNLIGRILDDRKKAFRGGNYSQYVQVHGREYPAILIAVDNFSAFQEKTNGAYEKVIVQLSKEGVSHGIFLLLSAGGFGMNEIPGRIGENLKTVLCLELPDKFSYGDVLHTTQIQVMPETGIKGRGLAAVSSRILEYQAALAMRAEDDYQRMEKISAEGARMDRVYHGRRAQQIPEIPAKPTWELFADLEETRQMARTDHLLPVGYNMSDAQVYGIDLSRVYCYLIMGSAGSGRKNFLKVLLESALLKGARVCLIDGDGLFRPYAGVEGLTYVSDGEELFTYFRDTLTPEFKRRNRFKQQVLAEDGEEEDVFAYTRKEIPIFLLITDLLWFFNTAYAPENTERGMNGFLETLTSRGRYHNIYFMGILNTADKTAAKGYQAFLNFASYKTGIHFGGNVSQNGILSFDYLPFQEQTKAAKPGIGQIPAMDGEISARRVVVPLVKRKRKTREDGEVAG